MIRNYSFLNSCRILSLFMVATIAITQPLGATFSFNQMNGAEQERVSFDSTNRSFDFQKQKTKSVWTRFKQQIIRWYEFVKEQIDENEEFLKGAGTILMAIGIYKLGMMFSDWFFEPYPRAPFKEQVLVGASQLNADVIHRDNNVVVRQIQSPQQGRNMCGYNCALNAEALAMAHHNPQANIAQFLEQGRADQQIRTWRDAVLANPNQFQGIVHAADGSNVRSDVIEFLLAQEQGTGNIRGINGVSFHVINGVQELEAFFKGRPDEKTGEMQQIDVDGKKRMNAANFNIFIICTAAIDGSTSSRDHWLTIAIDRQQHIYTVMNSTNGYCLDRNYGYGVPVMEAIDILEANIYPAPVPNPNPAQNPAPNQQAAGQQEGAAAQGGENVGSVPDEANADRA